MKTFCVYILKCKDNSYYTGITSDIENRLFEHNSSIKCNYTSKRRPVKLIYHCEFQSVKEAIDFEKQVKRWNRSKKEALIKGDFDELHKLACCMNKSYYKNRIL
jgi:putative endonuclease